jgi:solute carrier family 45 protein 1/2/4
MSKALLAVVWIASPLAGTLVQPYIGIRSDNCRSPWGKRKPFMVFGGAATIICLLALAWSREMVGGFLSIFGADRDSNGTKTMIIIVATLFMFALDFAINTGTSPLRSFPDVIDASDNLFSQCKLAFEHLFSTTVPPISKNKPMPGLAV